MSRLVFGQPIPPDMIPKGFRTVGKPGQKRKSYAMKDTRNPCLTFFGPGPEGVKCKNCIHLYGTGGNKAFLKCKLRGKATSGPATDHYAGWPACGKFEKA